MQPVVPQDRCEEDVTNLFAALDNLLKDVDPEVVCKMADFCSTRRPGVGAGEGASTPVEAPKALAGVAGAFAALVGGAPAGLGAGAGVGGGEDMCQNCKTIVMEAAAILQVTGRMAPAFLR